MVIGAGTSGMSAVAIALGLGARVLLLDASAVRLRGAVPRTSTYALTRGLNTHQGALTGVPVARAHCLPPPRLAEAVG